MRESSTDILILGSGGAGLFAALHAHQADPKLSITVAVKGLLGKSGCTRMVQGGYNVALAAGDSVERHFVDPLYRQSDELPGEFLVRQPFAALDRIHEVALYRVARRKRHVVATLDHARATGFAEQPLDRDGNRETGVGLMRVQRSEEPGTTGAENENVGFQLDHLTAPLRSTLWNALISPSRKRCASFIGI